MKHMVENLNLKDSLSVFNEVDTINRFKYHDKQYSTKSRFDYVFVSKDIDIETTKVVNPFHTNVIDHKLVLSQLKCKAPIRGPNYWKFNSQYLQDESYCQNIIKLISDCCENVSSLMTYQHIWEVLKIKIREFTIAYASNRSKLQKSEIRDLQERIDHLNVDGDNEKPENILELSDLSSRLNVLLEKESYGAFIRSKSKWCEKGEKCNRFFLSLESQRQCNNVIKSLKTSTGKVVKHDNEILKEISNYYQNLFAETSMRQKADINAYLSSVKNFNKISEKDKISCDKAITEDEIEAVISKLHSGKSPGLDGITPEFYKHFWPNLKVPFCNMLNETISKNVCQIHLHQWLHYCSKR